LTGLWHQDNNCVVGKCWSEYISQATSLWCTSAAAWEEINPFSVQFKSLLHGQGGSFFFQWAFKCT
jgi:hypothetical protein